METFVYTTKNNTTVTTSDVKKIKRAIKDLYCLGGKELEVVRTVSQEFNMKQSTIKELVHEEVDMWKESFKYCPKAQTRARFSSDLFPNAYQNYGQFEAMVLDNDSPQFLQKYLDKKGINYNYNTLVGLINRILDKYPSVKGDIDPSPRGSGFHRAHFQSAVTDVDGTLSSTRLDIVGFEATEAENLMMGRIADHFNVDETVIINTFPRYLLNRKTKQCLVNYVNTKAFPLGKLHTKYTFSGVLRSYGIVNTTLRQLRKAGGAFTVPRKPRAHR